MKRTLVIILAVFCLSTSFPIYSFAKEETDVGFANSFFEVGTTNAVIVEGYEPSKLNYRWYVDGRRIVNSSSEYAPIQPDLEKTIAVEVYYGKNLLGSCSSYFSKLPVIYIDTENGANVVSKDTYLDASFTLQGNSQYTEKSVLYDGQAQIKGRGHTSWDAAKKPYKIKLSSKANLLKMGKNKHWVLIANSYDPSGLRNTLSYELSGEYGIDYQQSRWVNLILNGKQLGVYQLCENVRVGSNRTDILDWEGIAEEAAEAIGEANSFSKADISELEDAMTENLAWVTDDSVTFGGKAYTVSSYYSVPDIDGGYMFEADSHYDEISKFTTTHGTYVNIAAPEYLNTNSEMFSYAAGYFQAFEDAVYSDDFTTVYNGKRVRYTDLADLDSIVIGWLVNDYFSNVDYPYRSTYYYLDSNSKLCFGPVWDMDCSSNGAQATKYYSFRSIEEACRTIMNKITRDPIFVKRARELYWQMRYSGISDIISDGGKIDRYSTYLKEALHKNDEIWGYDYTSDRDTADLKQWLCQKTEWLDSQFETDDSLYSALHPELYHVGMFTSQPDEIVQLSVTEQPSKTVYSVGEELDFTGLVLTAKTASGEEQTVSAQGYTVTMIKDGVYEIKNNSPLLLTAGEKNITFKYGSKSTSITIQVNKKYSVDEVTALIANLPAKLNINDKRSLEAAQAAYNTLSDSDAALVSNANKLISASGDIDEIIADARENNIAILNVYVEGTYRIGMINNMIVEMLPLNARSVRFEYPDGSTSTYMRSNKGVKITRTENTEIWSICSVSPKSANTLVSARGTDTEKYPFNPFSYENESVHIKSVFVPTVVTPEVEDERYYVYPATAPITITTAADVENVVICSGDSEFAASEKNEIAGRTVWTFTPPLHSAENLLQIKYTVDGREKPYGSSIPVYVRESETKPPEIISINVVSPPEKISYDYRSTLDTKGLTIVATYSDGSKETITSDFECTPTYFNSVGNKNITVSYGGKTDSFGVTVKYTLQQWIIRIVLFGWLWY